MHFHILKLVFLIPVFRIPMRDTMIKIYLVYAPLFLVFRIPMRDTMTETAGKHLGSMKRF